MHIAAGCWWIQWCANLVYEWLIEMHLIKAGIISFCWLISSIPHNLLLTPMDILLYARQFVTFLKWLFLAFRPKNPNHIFSLFSYIFLRLSENTRLGFLPQSWLRIEHVAFRCQHPRASEFWLTDPSPKRGALWLWRTCSWANFFS